MTNKVFEGLVFVEGLRELEAPPGLLIPRSCYNTEKKSLNKMINQHYKYKINEKYQY